MNTFVVYADTGIPYAPMKNNAFVSASCFFYTSCIGAIFCLICHSEVFFSIIKSITILVVNLIINWTPHYISLHGQGFVLAVSDWFVTNGVTVAQSPFVLAKAIIIIVIDQRKLPLSFFSVDLNLFSHKSLQIKTPAQVAELCAKTNRPIQVFGAIITLFGLSSQGELYHKYT